MGRFYQSVLLLATLSTSVLAQQACSSSQQCPQETPCCSQYGQCGTGAYCLGGCDPVSSFSLTSCVPAPVCESKTYTFENLNGISSNTEYLGDASKADWVSSGQPLAYNNNVLLTMAEGSVGTLLRSTHYVWYGKVHAKMSTSAGAGVVTAFILLGDSKDEIDFEFVGADLTQVQTNFYSQGVTVYTNGENINNTNDVHAEMHDYTFDWQPDSITWSIDNQVVRTLNREDTWNATANRYYFPQTPCQVQLSLWPAGLSSNPEGTITWAGGLIQWDSPYMTNGYYYAAFEQVDVQCYDPPSGYINNGTKSYLYTNDAMTNDTVEITNNPYVMSSFEASGLDLTLGGTTVNTTSNNTVPGLSGGGSGANGQRGNNGTSTSGSGSTASATQPASTATATGFSQGNGGMSGASAVYQQSEGVVKGSLFAVIVAIVGLCVL